MIEENLPFKRRKVWLAMALEAAAHLASITKKARDQVTKDNPTMMPREKG